MAKSDRHTHRLEELEESYRSILIKALTDCAGGRWGLFGQNEHLWSREKPEELEELRELARSIDRIRASIGEEPFELHRKFEAARGRAGANDPGEPRLARAWLQLLAELYLQVARDCAEQAESLLMQPASFDSYDWSLLVGEIVEADRLLRSAREADPAASLPLLDTVLEDLRDVTANFTRPEFLAATKADRRGNPKLFEPKRQDS